MLKAVSHLLLVGKRPEMSRVECMWLALSNKCFLLNIKHCSNTRELQTYLGKSQLPIFPLFPPPPSPSNLEM